MHTLRTLHMADTLMIVDDSCASSVCLSRARALTLSLPPSLTLSVHTLHMADTVMLVEHGCDAIKPLHTRYTHVTHGRYRDACRAWM